MFCCASFVQRFYALFLYSFVVYRLSGIYIWFCAFLVLIQICISFEANFTASACISQFEQRKIKLIKKMKFD